MQPDFLMPQDHFLGTKELFLLDKAIPPAAGDEVGEANSGNYTGGTIMNLTKQSIILVMALMLGLSVLAGVSQAAVVMEPNFYYMGSGGWEFSGNEFPVTVESPDEQDQSWVKLGDNPFIDTKLDPNAGEYSNINVHITWTYTGEESHVVDLAFKFKGSQGCYVYWSDATGSVYEYREGTGDDVISVQATFTLDSDNNWISLQVDNNGGEASITEFSGLPLPTPTHTPVPASVLLLGTGLMGLGALGWRRRPR
ncbi:MAG: PEP-CTERM sorting domain-containing protein [Desulfobaccales bacterium]